MEKQLLSGAYLIPMDPARSVHKGWGVVIADDRIEETGPVEKLREKHPDAREEHFEDCLLLPGFIDCGGFAGMQLFKGAAQTSARRREVIERYWRTADDAPWEEEGELCGAARLQCGVTTGAVNFPGAGEMDQHAYFRGISRYLAGYSRTGAQPVAGVGLAQAEAAPALGQFLTLLRGMDLSVRVYLERLIVSNKGFSRATDANFSGLTEDDLRTFAAARELSQRYLCGVTANAFGNDVAILMQAGETLRGMGALLQLCTDMNYAEVRRIAEDGAAVAHMPRETIRYCPFSEFLEAGATCAVMSDAPFTGGSFDMLQAVRRAQMIEQLRFDDFYCLPAGRQLELITIDAARALGLERKIGSLEAGKRADLVLVRMDLPRTVPYEDMPLHRLMIDANARQITRVYVAGACAVLDGRPLYGAYASLPERTQEAALRARAASGIESLTPPDAYGSPYCGYAYGKSTAEEAR